MLVLPVDVHEELARLAQLRERHRGSVDECARAPSRIDHTPEQTHALVARELALLQPAPERLRVVDLEFGGDLRALGALPHDDRIGAFSEHERQRIDEDRLPRARLAGEHGETAFELELEAI